MTEDKSTRYHRLKRRADILDLGWSAVLLVGLLLTGGAQRLRDIAHAVTGGHLYASVAGVVVAIAILHALVSFPLAIYSGFVLERRYELSRQTFGGWLLDQVKSAVLALVLGEPALLLVYATMAHAPAWWWAAFPGWPAP